MNKETLRQLIKATKGRFFTITFKTTDGRIRTACSKDKYFDMYKGGSSKLSKSDAVSFIDRNKGNGRGEWISAKASNVIGFRCGNSVLYGQTEISK